jgi:hypothetical protein
MHHSVHLDLRASAVVVGLGVETIVCSDSVALVTFCISSNVVGDNEKWVSYLSTVMNAKS